MVHAFKFMLPKMQVLRSSLVNENLEVAFLVSSQVIFSKRKSKSVVPGCEDQKTIMQVLD